ncbi:MAG: molybdopterin molybdotransferase MoeA [Magnetococcus sp. DMHC-6]
MISFAEARAKILAEIQPITQTISCQVPQALGRVLATPIQATFNVPNHDNSAMDGYGIRSRDLNRNKETLLMVVADLPAGDKLTEPLKAGQAVRIMTGAPLPDGCDCVVKQEDVRWERDSLVIPTGMTTGQNIRLAGEDIRAGTELFTPGRRLTPADLGLLTSLGLTEISVFEQLKVAVLSTGNELQPPGVPLPSGHVYDSNRPTLIAAVQAMGLATIDLGLARDNLHEIREALRIGSQTANAVISSGGVSVGDYDLVKEVLEEQGNIHFWKVAMKPGKPQAYGRLGNAAFFGLPGNPVSSLAVFLLMVRPALLKMMGAAPEPIRAFKLPLKGDIHKHHERMDFYRGVVHYGPEGPWVTTTGAQGSGILSSMSQANAFIVLPESPVTIKSGELVNVWMIDYA